MSKTVKKLIQSAKREQITQGFMPAVGKSDFWKAFKRLEGKQNPVPDHLISDGSFTSTSQENANLLADQIDAVWLTTDNSPLITIPDQCNNHAFMTDIGDVYGNLINLNVNKAPGYDAIPPIFYRNCAYTLVPAIATIISRSMRERLVPEIWKHSIAAPVRKKDPSNQRSNWRPINVLNVAMKLLEKHVLKVLKPFRSN